MGIFELKDVEEIRPDFFVKKTKKGYRQVYPPHKDITKPLSLKNMNWKRAIVGNPQESIMVVVVIGIILFLAFAYLHDMAECREIIQDENFMFMWNNYKSEGTPNMKVLNISNLSFDWKT
jgi:hypothetical protein